MDQYITYPSQEFILKDIDSNSRTIVQAFAKYNVPDADKDISRKGMFTKTWQENKGRIKHLLNHDTVKPVAKPEQFYDENDYAVVKSKIGSHKLGSDFLEMALSGLITEASYGAQVIRSNRLQGGGREILESRLWEVSSLTHWGAQGDTPLFSITKMINNIGYEEKLLSRVDAVEKFCRNAEASDETIQLLLIENKQLTELLLTIKSTQAATKAPSPDVRIFSNALQQFTQTLI